MSLPGVRAHTGRVGAGAHPLALLFVLLLFAVGAPDPARGQDRVWLRGPDGERDSVTISEHRGYAAFPVTVLSSIGWSVQRSGRVFRASLGREAVLVFVGGTPYFRWNDTVLQLADSPYLLADQLHLPLQLVTDILPALLSEKYRYEPVTRTILTLDAGLWRGAAPVSAALSDSVASGADQGPEPAAKSKEEEAIRPVVVIDPGHGGRDPGSIGAAGVQEKDVVLKVALVLARELRKGGDLDVYLTRDRDAFIDLWDRGKRATSWKGDREGIFISLHANAAPKKPGVRGFETFFLAEARTDHAARVVENENAPLRFGGGGNGGILQDSDLAGILRELRNRDYQRGSMLLAELVQEELESFHPGPDRGVKQGILAVLTNALMPSVLVEIGFLTNRTEERLLTDPGFHDKVGRAVARAARSFFDRYPSGPRSKVGGGGETPDEAAGGSRREPPE